MKWPFLVLACAVLVAGVASAGEATLLPAKLWHVRDGLPNVLEKLKGDGEVAIAYFGGSITAANGWRPKTLKWFQKTWPGAKVSEIHAAIGGTGSDLGAFRCENDVLKGKPDLVFVEFAVNDGGAPPERIVKTIEGIVRQIWRANAETDICFVYTIHQGMLKDYEAGNYSRSATAMERVAEHYGIPTICMALRIAELKKAGKLVFHGERGTKPPEGKFIFTHDSCHPTDAGHAVFTEVIADAIKAMDGQPKAAPHELKKPMDPDNWEDARLFAIEPSMLKGSWRKLDKTTGLGKRFGGRLPTIWHGGTPGDTLTFRYKGTLCRLFDLVGPDGGIAVCTVDGGKPAERQRFDWYCTYHRLQAVTVASTPDGGEHTVAIEISPKQPDREPVLKRVRDQKGFDPKRYDGTNLWIGYIMLRGELVKK